MKTFSALFFIISGLLVAYYYVQTHGLPIKNEAAVSASSEVQPASEKSDKAAADEPENKDSDENNSEDPFEFGKKEKNNKGSKAEASAMPVMKNSEETAVKPSGKADAAAEKKAAAKKSLRKNRKSAKIAAKQEALAQSLIEYKNKKHISRLTKDKKGENIIPAVEKIITEAGFETEGIDLSLNEAGTGFISSSTWKYSPAANK